MLRRCIRVLAAAPLALGLSLLAAAPAGALVPYVYVPRPQELESSGLGIAQAASRLLRMGQAEDAARLAALTVQLLPDDPRGWILLAEAQLRSRQNQAAGQSLARAKQLDPGNPGIWFAEGSLALRNGQPREAQTLLRHGLGLDSRNAGAYFDLGNSHLLLQEPKAALAAFERASGLRKDFWESINNQALVLFELDRRSEAIGRWRRSLSIRPTAAEPMLALAAALHVEALRKGTPSPGEALDLANQALASEPNYVLEAYQQEQLWGPKLRQATRQLLAQAPLQQAVERAQANAGGSGGEEDE